ncbi:MAG: hypothetical protein ACRDVO_13605 [Jiangellaceae bacterium]
MRGRRSISGHGTRNSTSVTGNGSSARSPSSRLRRPRNPAITKYRTPTAGGDQPGGLEIPPLPYHAWANRGPSTMRVWMPWLEETR